MKVLSVVVRSRNGSSMRYMRSTVPRMLSALCSVVTTAWLVLYVPNPQRELGMRFGMRVQRLGLLVRASRRQWCRGWTLYVLSSRSSTRPPVGYGWCARRSLWLEALVEPVFARTAESAPVLRPLSRSPEDTRPASAPACPVFLSAELPG